MDIISIRKLSKLNLQINQKYYKYSKSKRVHELIFVLFCSYPFGRFNMYALKTWVLMNDKTTHKTAPWSAVLRVILEDDENILCNFV